MEIKDAKRMAKIQQWTAVFHERFDSGLTVRQFCRENNISHHAYYYWLKIVREGILSGQEAKHQIVEIPAAYPAQVTGADPDRPGGTECGHIAGGSLTIEKQGFRITVTEDTGSALLARVLGVIADA